MEGIDIEGPLFSQVVKALSSSSLLTVMDPHTAESPPLADMVTMLPGWSDAYSGPPSIVMDPEPIPPVSIPLCERVTVLVRAGPDGPKPMPVLYSPATNKHYLFTKKLVQEKVRVLIMMARELEPVTTTAPLCASSAPGSSAAPALSPSGPSPAAPSSSTTQPCRCPFCNTAATPCVPASSPSCPPPPAATAPSCSCCSSSSTTCSTAAGTVWVPGEAVVVKVTDKNYLKQDGELIENPLDEVAAMKVLSEPGGHDNILGVLDCMQDSEYLYVVLPYLPGKDLFHKMKSRTKGLSPMRARRILREVISGLLYMKKHRIAHRDLSLENIMFDGKGTSKIIDFGMCVRVPRDVTGCCSVLLSSQRKRGKASYVCPEIVREDVLDPFAADVWSLGVILFIMLTLTPLYQSPDDVAFRMLCNGQYDELLNHYETLGVGISAPARSLIRGMLCPEAESRLSLEEILRHPWMMVNDDDSSPNTRQHVRPGQQMPTPAHSSSSSSSMYAMPPAGACAAAAGRMSPKEHHHHHHHHELDGSSNSNLVVDVYSSSYSQ